MLGGRCRIVASRSPPSLDMPSATPWASGVLSALTAVASARPSGHAPRGGYTLPGSFIAKFFLALPDSPLTSIHSSFLGPYYSVTSPQSFLQQLVALGNAVAQRGPEDKNARRVVNNLEEWADGRYATEKELLLEAIKQRSHFTFDVIHWIKQVTAVLLFVSNAPLAMSVRKKSFGGTPCG
jgi:hypothetical protein